MAEKLNKLQIRAKVFEIIKSYKSEDDFSSDLHYSNLKILNSVNEKKFLLEILIKELTNAVDFELEVVKFLLSEFATLEDVEEIVWQLLKDMSLPDSKKEVYLHLLRALGGKVDVHVLMDCMEDFAGVVDNQTKELLEIATVNPEAQIDFLDFLFSLKEKEQLQLIHSLEDDFPGDELANILTPCLLIGLPERVKEEVVNILANSASYLAVKPLKNFILANTDGALKKIALKALNRLKNSGIDVDDDTLVNLRENEVCKGSVFYKAYLSQIDGCGNQGLLFSRITDKDKIVMFSTVINVSDGIIDCFGLQDITVSEFQKVIGRFRDNDIVVPISAELAKVKLLQAENKNKQKGIVLPYEYLCWGIYCCDIQAIEPDYEILNNAPMRDYTNEDYKNLYETEVFDTWFFEYDDKVEVQRLIDLAVSLKNVSPRELVEQLECKIEDIYYKVFNLAKLDEYSAMLNEAAFVFYMNKDFLRANISSNLAEGIKNGETRLLKDVLRRSVLQYLAGIAGSDEQQNLNQFGEKEKTITDEEAFSLLQNLEEKWERLASYE